MLSSVVFFSCPVPHRDLHSFPTRRSSDLPGLVELLPARGSRPRAASRSERSGGVRRQPREDRKSTRLNSSHANISYAVFCLKKKKQKNKRQRSTSHTVDYRRI